MNSKNQKQEELVRRLEEIRRQRSTIQSEQEQTTSEQPVGRNQQGGNRTRKNRNRNSQQSSTNRRTSRNSPVSNRKRTTRQDPVALDDPSRHSQETYNIGHQHDEQAEARHIREAQIREKDRVNELANKKVSTQKKRSNSLIEQLSDADRLSQAIILNEVLGKPIALKPKSR